MCKKQRKWNFPRKILTKDIVSLTYRHTLMSASKIDVYLENDGCEEKSGGGGEDMEVGQDTYFLY